MSTWFDAASWPRRGVVVLLFCLGSAMTLALTRSDGRWDAQFVYSLATGMGIWLLMESGARVLRLRFADVFALSWRSALLVMGSVALGYVLGTAAGDRYLGVSTWELATRRTGLFVGFIAFTVASVAVAMAWFAAKLKREKLASELAQAQLALLRSQLEPHMLFNTLANLRALIETEPPSALVMLDHLDKWLRATLRANRQAAAQHTVADELERLRDYTALMGLRMGPRLQVSFDCESQAAKQPLAPMLLQPLVENALVHGLEPAAQGGRLQVSAQVADGQLRLAVRNSGVALAQQHATGFGLGSTAQRVRAAAGQFELRTETDGTTVARIALPLPHNTP